MKATINGIEVELTPEEFQKLTKHEEKKTEVVEEDSKEEKPEFVHFAKRAWTPEEDWRLRELHKAFDKQHNNKKDLYEHIQSFMPDRTIIAVRERASKLRLTKSDPSVIRERPSESRERDNYTFEDNQKIASIYRDYFSNKKLSKAGREALQRAFPHRNYRNVMNKAIKLGVIDKMRAKREEEHKMYFSRKETDIKNLLEQKPDDKDLLKEYNKSTSNKQGMKERNHKFFGNFPEFKSVNTNDEVNNLIVAVKNVIANKTHLNFLADGGLFGIQNGFEWRSFVEEFMNQKKEVADYFGVPDKFGINLFKGKFHEITYGWSE